MTSAHTPPNTAVSAAKPPGNPYKGAVSYQVEDAALFFGRDREAKELTARILANRLTILHAISGAGKTSLLNARIIPAVEAHGWVPVRTTPDENPLHEIRRDTLFTMFPPFEAEAFAVRDAARCLRLDETASIEAFLERFDRSELNPQEQRRLLAPVENRLTFPKLAADARAIAFPSAQDIAPGFQRATPYVSRVLRRTVGVARLLDHVRAIRQAGLGDAQPIELGPQSTIGDLLTVLEDDDLREAYRSLIAWLQQSPEGLRPFFENVVKTYGAAMPRCGLVLLLDQFEQIFTLFGGRARKGPESDTRTPVRPWTLRRDLFDALRALYTEDTATSEAWRQLPIRYVISLRDDYVGQLEGQLSFVTDLDASSYRLGWLPYAESKEAIEKPAAQYGRDYAPECVNEILDGLADEASTIEPARLQLVCTRVWENHTANNHGPQIVLEDLGPGGVDGILRDVFRRFFEPFSGFEKLELLDMLAPLLTFSRTRNIVEHGRLVNMPFRRVDVRERLLKSLLEQRIVRKDPRPSGDYYELTHEFLIEPVLQELRTNTEYDSISRALAALTGRVGGEVAEPLPDYIFAALDQHEQMLGWSPEATEVMFRNAVIHGAAQTVLMKWAQRFRKSGGVAGAGEQAILRSSDLPKKIRALIKTSHPLDPDAFRSLVTRSSERPPSKS
jgi:hypothetical protein